MTAQSPGEHVEARRWRLSIEQFASAEVRLLEHAVCGAAMAPQGPEVAQALDEAAGAVVDRMKHLEVRSALQDEADGGPPSETNSRPWKKVMSWLANKLAQILEFLWNAVEAFSVLVRRLFGPAAQLPTISIGLSLPPSVIFGLETPDIVLSDAWPTLRAFVRNTAAEMGEQFA